MKTVIDFEPTNISHVSLSRVSYGVYMVRIVEKLRYCSGNALYYEPINEFLDLKTRNTMFYGTVEYHKDINNEYILTVKAETCMPHYNRLSHDNGIDNWQTTNSCHACSLLLQVIHDILMTSSVVDLIIKFGGSAITVKENLETAKADDIQQAARLVKKCVDAGLKCIVVHGAG